MPPDSPAPEPAMQLSVFILGVIAMTAQITFLREVLATFRGGELTIGTALLFWLLWTAVGSGILGRMVNRAGNPRRLFFDLLPWYGVFGYAGVAVTGGIPFLLRLTPGELVPYDLQFIAVGLAFMPFNMLGGFLFALVSQALTDEHSAPVGRAYTLEAFGSALAGIVISLALIPFVPNDTIARGSGFIGCTAGIIGAVHHSRRSRFYLYLLPLAMFALVWRVDSSAARYPYTGQQLLGECDTRFGRLRATRQGEQTTFYSNASMLFSDPDPETNEYAVHIPILSSRNPRRVLLLGGNPGAMAAEVLKYKSIEQVVCVEIDPGLFDLVDRFLGRTGNDDLRVERIVADGRAYLERNPATFDVIVMNMPDPLSGVSNRYYTEEFFKLASSRLSDSGILGFSLTGDENVLSEDLALFLATVKTTLDKVFPSTIVLPGVMSRYLACNAPGKFEGFRWETLNEALLHRNIETQYVRDYYLSSVFSPYKIEYIQRTIAGVASPPVNTDLKPVGYVIRTLLQGSLEASRIIGMLKPIVSPELLTIFLASVILFFILFTVLPGKGHIRRPVAATVMSVGLTEISLEVIAIMAYQSFFGFLYGRIALLIGSYMAGLALGGFGGTRAVERGKAGMNALAGIQACIMTLPLMWAGLLMVPVTCPVHGPLVETAFYVLTGLSGLCGGFQFPIADTLYRETHPQLRSRKGAIYGIDLAGSSVGALFTASLAVPVLGMYGVLWFLTALNGLSAFFVWLKRVR